MRDVRKEVWKLIDEKVFQQAVEQADKGLASNPVDIELLMGKEVALRALKDDRAAEIKARWMALADSILISGDGKSFKSAFRVISVDEEYTVIGLLGLKSDGQALRADTLGMYDVLTVHPRSGGDRSELYFNIDLPWSQLHGSFGAKK